MCYSAEPGFLAMNDCCTLALLSAKQPGIHCFGIYFLERAGNSLIHLPVKSLTAVTIISRANSLFTS
jgi:hypothetical protein